jgi:ornithine carbamoyltransferase
LETTSLKGRDFLSIADLNTAEITLLLDTAARLKAETRQGTPHHILAGKTIALLFEKPSLRTRLSFDVGMYQLGGRAMYLSPSEVGLGKREPARDIARVIGSMCDAIVARVFDHKNLQEMATYTDKPVINALSDVEHPCQMLADLLTVQERLGTLEGLTLAYIGDGNNVAHSIMLGAALVGMNVVIATPPGYEPNEEVAAEARRLGQGRSSVKVVHNLEGAVAAAHVLYTDVWASMGQEAEAEARKAIFQPYQINSELLRLADPNAIVLHCLPAHRGDEITDEIMEDSSSAVFEQAENRLHAQKALLAHLLGGL